MPLGPLVAGRAAMVALDVGANKGYWAKGLLRAFGDQVAHVYMVEPSPENCRELALRDDNLMFEPADFSRLSVKQAAMGERAGVVRLYTNEDGSPLASLYPHLLNGYDGGLRNIDLSTSIDVPMVSLDDYIEEIGCGHIDILKLDVEGHEMSVLKGARNAFEASAIDIVSLEFGIHQVESRHFFQDFYVFFRKYGYELFFIRGGALESVDRYDYRYEDFRTNYQLVAKRQEIATRIVTPTPANARVSNELSLDLPQHTGGAAICVRERDRAGDLVRNLTSELVRVEEFLRSLRLAHMVAQQHDATEAKNSQLSLIKRLRSKAVRIFRL